MTVPRIKNMAGTDIALNKLSEEITEWDQQAYERVISNKLTPDQQKIITQPQEIHPRQKEVLAVHWHPEHVPLELVRRRIQTMFPNRKMELVIPTQHNELLTFDGYSGVEVDCFSPEFNRKVQLLAHFEESKLASADVFKAMLVHTFRYRARQLFDFIDSIIDPDYEDRIQKAAVSTGADENLIKFVQIQVKKLKKLYEANESRTPPDAIKNKLIRHFFDTLREHHDAMLINHAQLFLKAVKKIVKENFNLDFFYETQEVIEEIRSLGGGIVIPHPEQFWPILLAEYDVDGYEVWNPQSREYTEFLIRVVHQQNKTRKHKERSILLFMGDDCHLGEKIRDPMYQDPEKAGRQVGVQPAWEDLAIRKSLIVANADRPNLIEEYRARLSS